MYVIDIQIWKIFLNSHQRLTKLKRRNNFITFFADILNSFQNFFQLFITNQEEFGLYIRLIEESVIRYPDNRRSIVIPKLGRNLASTEPCRIRDYEQWFRKKSSGQTNGIFEAWFDKHSLRMHLNLKFLSTQTDIHFYVTAYIETVITRRTIDWMFIKYDINSFRSM